MNSEVENNYYKTRKFHTKSFVDHLKSKYLNFTNKMEILEILERLASFQDKCNTDKYHAFHTANKLKADNHPEWLIVVGLIHEIGKIIYLKGCDKDGTTEKEQWSIVGNTFAVGCKIPDSMVYNEFNHVNPDQINTYKDGCGLDKMTISFSHNEYSYQMLMFSKNKHKLPDIALYIIRYHSLYVHHQHRAYKRYESDLDRNYLKYLQLFQKYECSQENDTPYIDYVYYKELLTKYFQNTFLYI